MAEPLGNARRQRRPADGWLGLTGIGRPPPPTCSAPAGPPAADPTAALGSLAPSADPAKPFRVASDLRPNCCFFSQANCRLSASICCTHQPTKTTNCAMSFSAASALCFHCCSRWIGAGMLGPIIMSRLPITPLLPRGRSVARRSYVLVDADHRSDTSRGGAACPAQNVGIGEFTEGLPMPEFDCRRKSLWNKELAETRA